MRRRPWPILILAFLQIFVEPIYNVFLSSYLSHAGPVAYLQHMAARGRWADLFYILVLPPIMGLCVYAMKRWSYALFIAGATWMLFKNLQVAQAGAVSMAWFILYYVGNIAFVGYFLAPAVVRPYLRRELRWWESKPRYLVDYDAVIATADGEVRGKIQDFSVGGVFVTTAKPIDMSTVHSLRITGSGVDLEVTARPVFQRPTSMTDSPYGYGLRYADLSAKAKADVLGHAKALRKAHALTLLRPIDAWTDFKTWLKELVRTGHGLMPRTETAKKPTEEKADETMRPSA